MKHEHQISKGVYHTWGLRQKDSIVFIVQRKILNEIAKGGHYSLTGVRWGETLSRHVIDLDKLEHAKI